jgi:uncharacterized protein (DUF58 family)
MLLSIILFSGILGITNIKNLDITLHQVEDLYANRYANVKLVVKNRYKRLYIFLLTIKLGDEKVILDVLKGGSQSDHFIKILFNKRGIHRPGDVFVTSFYPFNFFVRGKYCKLNKDFLVYPEPKKPSDDFSKSLNYISAGNAVENSIFNYKSEDIDSLKEYSIGDSIKDINWKSFYKYDKIMVKKYESTSVKPVIIEIKDNDNVEKILSFATFIVDNCIKKNIPIGLKINNYFFKPSTGIIHRNMLLKNLALYNEVNTSA